MQFWRFIDVDPNLVVEGTLDPLLVFVSWLIATTAAFAALSVKDVMQRSTDAARIRWLLIGSISMGVGVWAMHFTGMIAFQLPAHQMTYVAWITAVSILPAIGAAAWAIDVLARAPKRFSRLLFPAFLAGVGIGLMHYIGMEAMEMHGLSLAYDPWMFALSLVGAYALATIALAVNQWTGSKLFSACIMGGAVAGMHYTAMGAAIFYYDMTAVVTAVAHIPHDIMAGFVVLISLVLLVSVTVASALDKRLSDSLSRQDMLLSLFPYGVVTANADFKIIDANPAAHTIFEVGVGELRSKSLEDLLVADCEEKLRLMLAAKDTPWSISTAQGTQRLLEISCVASIEENSEKFTLVLHDVTSKRERETRLRRLAVALDQTRTAIVMCQYDGTVEYMNQTAGEWFGELENCRETLDIVFTNRSCGQALKESGHWTHKARLELLGELRPYSFSVSSFSHDESGVAGTPEYFIGIRDVSSEDDMESKLRQAQKLESIGQLASGIAHEINTPSQYVADNVSFLDETWQDISGLLAICEKELDKNDALADAWEEADVEYLREEVPVALQHCSSGLEQIKKIVLAMKRFAHPGEDGMEMANLNELIESTATIARNEWKYVAELETEFAADLNDLPCVKSALNQVFLNMIVNAAHAIEDRWGQDPSKGKITIGTSNVDDGVLVTIRDNGQGIPKDIRQKIFDPFYTTKEVGRGSGQGLAIAFNVVSETHHGQITLESSVGEGTEFSIFLPFKHDNLVEVPSQGVA